MKDNLKNLEIELSEFAQKTNFSQKELEIFPENLRQIFSFRIFGPDLIALPGELICDGDKNEMERPFSLINDQETLNVFESEFRSVIPKEFIQIGHIYGATEIVLFNKISETVHTFHVSDSSDLDWLKYKLEN